MGNLRKRARRGVSLIEVLVVLVLLVLGILIIVRLFPSGFFSINSVGDAALADGLGQAAVSAQAQNAAELPEGIYPDTSLNPLTATDTLTAATFTDAQYDPDDPNKLNNARVITNETVTVPAPSGPNRQSIYVVNYGPIFLPVAPTASNVTDYLTVNSSAWEGVDANSVVLVSGQNDVPQTIVFSDQQKFALDAANTKIALPYASYTGASPAASTSVGTSVADSYARKFMVAILASDGKTYTQYLNLPAATKRDNTNPYAPFGSDNLSYLADTTTAYHGGWFNPVTDYADPAPPNGAPAHTTIPTTNAQGQPIIWQKVKVYRAYTPVAVGGAFGSDPYQYRLTSVDIVDGSANGNANLGAIEFNPIGAGRSGANALKAQISYITYSWGILHEDRDVAPLSGTDTSVARLTLKNIKRAGDSGPDNVIYTGLIPGSYQSMVVLDLDTGQPVGEPPANQPPDPTLTSGAIWDEDLNGSSIDKTFINISYSTGRVTFNSDVFGDNSNGITPRAHRVRIYYAAEGDWTVAVQKAPSYYTPSPNSAAGADPQLLPGQYAFDPAYGAKGELYFPQSDSGKSVEIDGTYTDGNGAFKTFAATIALSNTVTTLGATKYVTVALDDQNLAGGLNNITATQVKVNAVRGLSARAVVAWKERDRWKVHTVDTVLTRAQ